MNDDNCRDCRRANKVQLADVIHETTKEPLCAHHYLVRAGVRPPRRIPTN